MRAFLGINKISCKLLICGVLACILYLSLYLLLYLLVYLLEWSLTCLCASGIVFYFSTLFLTVLMRVGVHLFMGRSTIDCLFL